MSPNGRVTLPAEARRALGLKGESLFEVHQTDTAIVLRPVAVVPLEQERDGLEERLVVLGNENAERRGHLEESLPVLA